MAEYRFPEGFIWGCATASYQNEGSPLADGAGESIWHRFSHTPDKVMNGDTGDVACDHYERYKEDVALMKRLGLNSYRFSVSWSRIFPEGKGRINQAGLDFYQALVDELVAANITPCLTLYHWDLPQALQDAGGWMNPDTSLWFQDYAALLFDKLGDKVALWLTLNEPVVIAFIGHGLGVHPPCVQDMDKALLAGHTLLQAHGRAVEAFRQSGSAGQIGITIDLEASMPATDSPEDKAAAQRHAAFQNQWFLDPIYFGRYPEEMVAAFPALPGMDPDDAKLISQPLDFIGFNYYTRTVWEHDERCFMQAQQIFPDGTYTRMETEQYPEGLDHVLTWLDSRYSRPSLYITENGAAFDDTDEPDGSINDDDRLDYVREHLKVCHRCIEKGIDLRGYYLWSLMDNFEWTFGYSRKLGIVHVDFTNQKRTIKKSGHWYSNVIRDNGFSD